MEQFRLVILDYPKLLLENPDVKRAFGDVVVAKQRGFERSHSDYVSLDSLDMISTHIIIYDTAKIFDPKPVLALRICYEDRVRRHKLTLPIDNYIGAVPEPGPKTFSDLRTRKKSVVDCNAWFVDANYSYSKTGVPLSDMGIFATVTHILRRGDDHLVGCANEKFKASRWFEPVGNFLSPMEFTHPKVPEPHKLVLIDGFSQEWLNPRFARYESLMKSRIELVPSRDMADSPLMSYEELQTMLKGEGARRLRAA